VAILDGHQEKTKRKRTTGLIRQGHLFTTSFMICNTSLTAPKDFDFNSIFLHEKRNNIQIFRHFEKEGLRFPENFR
jgi:hypothetical protein